MTTHMHRPPTITAHTTPTPALYTVTAHLNIFPLAFLGYEEGHPLTLATHPDTTPLNLAFHPSTRIHDHETAADAAFTVGNYQRPDDTGQAWPDSLRSISVGDVLTVTAPDGTVRHLSVDSCGFTTVPKPATPAPGPYPTNQT
ncbi:hypothetical protein ABT160_29840 [Streptomyces sp. NPDC001941]|uniref:hypothetical protein n=1 Tax=Streptomyces sp. NPDC001941 TaxID=3154659 RepID=UPI00332CC8E0